jgi:carboxypeptidase family protein/TonB-dependent receptor-like protein
MDRQPALNLVVRLLMLFSFASAGYAQIGTSSVVGRIVDEAGMPVANVDVQLLRGATNEAFRTVTTASGDYSLVSLPVDTYSLRASTEGFKTAVREKFTLEVGHTYRADFNLSPGDANEVVVLSGEISLLQTETPEFGEVIDNKKIESRPLNDRDVLGTLGALTPGMTPEPGSKSSGTGSGLSFNVRGMRKSDNLLLVDGTMMSEGNGGVTFTANPDSVQEFEVKTGLYGAEYGIRPGGQFSMITKSGTNEFHGTLYEFLRNDNLDARNFFDRAGRPEFKRNQFGGGIGGPVRVPHLVDGRDHVWFFASYNGMRIRRLLSLTGVMPTPEQKQGQFHEPITDPLTGQPFPNDRIPAGRINPIAQKLLAFWPNPNTPGSLNYTSTNSSANQDNDQVIVKIDWKTSEKSRWSSRFIHDNAPFNSVNVIDTFRRVDPLSTWAQNITNSRVIGPRTVNDFGFHFFRRPYYAGGGKGPLAKGFGLTLGIPNFPLRPIDVDGVPSTTVTGFTLLGDRNFAGPVNIGNWEVRDNFAFDRGAHAFKAGYHFRRHYNFYALERRSSFRFEPRYSGNAFADFLLGLPTSTAQGDESVRGNFAQNGHYWYLQDSWKVNSATTLNLGLRYEYRAPWVDKRGFLSSFDPVQQDFVPALSDQPLLPYETGRFAAGEPVVRWHNRGGWLPRVGLAYRPTAQTVLKIGYGIYSNEPLIRVLQLLAENPRPNARSITFLSDPAKPTLSLSDPFNESTAVSGAALPNVGGFQNPLPQSLVHSWGASAQYELTPNTLFEIGYQGSHAVHELQLTSFNDAAPGLGPRQERRPNPSIQNYQVLLANGDNNFHGMEVKVQRRPGSSDLSLSLAYTWSKTINTVGGRSLTSGETGVISRNMPLLQNRGVDESNVPNRLALTASYHLPFGTGKTMLTDGFWGKLLGGWSVNGIVSVQSGPFITPRIVVDRLDVGSTDSSRPDVIRTPNLPKEQRTPEHWFDTSAFVMPAEFKYGNAGRSIIQTPGFMNLDVSVLRSFPIHEVRLELRFEAFNATNHTNFGVPEISFDTPSFGAIGSALDARQIQLGMKLHF